MCGYFFTNQNKSKIDLSKLKKVRKLLNNRGPDSKKTVYVNNNVFVFSRLSIIDIKTRANQPFTDSLKRHHLVFNGEIYNYAELKEELLIKGVKFKTSSDTEVLFKSLVIFGIDQTLKKIQGMFSFLFYDVKTKSLVGARDHFGQKPFYYSHYKNKIFISTNVNCIKLFFEKLETNKESIKTYVSTKGLYNPTNTFFKSIKKLRAGHKIKIYKNQIKISRYFNPSDLLSKDLLQKYKKIHHNDRLKILDEKMQNAINLTSISDRPLGVCLSGGVDSSLALYYSPKKNIASFSNFSKGIEKISFRYIPKILKKIKIKNNFKLLINKKNYLKDLIKLIEYSNNVAVWGGGPPMSNLCKLAKKKNRVVLFSGDGLDEFSLGYNPHNNAIKNFNNDIFYQNSNFQLNKNSPFFKSRSSAKYNDFLKIKTKKNLEKISKILKKNISKKELFIRLMIVQELDIFLQSCTLTHNDEYSMYNSVEMRSPFLTIDLIKFVINQPINVLYNKKTNKPLIRDLFNLKFGKNLTSINKEGTRNYSKYISNKKFWNFEKFYISDFLKINFSKITDYRVIYNLINVELFFRNCILKDKKNIMNLIKKPLR